MKKVETYDVFEYKEISVPSELKISFSLTVAAAEGWRLVNVWNSIEPDPSRPVGVLYTTKAILERKITRTEEEIDYIIEKGFLPVYDDDDE